MLLKVEYLYQSSALGSTRYHGDTSMPTRYQAIPRPLGWVTDGILYEKKIPFLYKIKIFFVY